jgi:hypothetical protein
MEGSKYIEGRELYSIVATFPMHKICSANDKEFNVARFRYMYIWEKLGQNYRGF